MNYIKKYHLSILTALFIIFISLVNPHKIPDISKSFTHADKIIHAGIYFFFMAVIIYESRFTITKRKLWFLTIIPILFGVIMELSQGFFTSYRSGNIPDLLSNIFGIFLCVIICLYYRPFSNKIF